MTEPTRSLAAAALGGVLGRCPRCGKESMFSGFLGLRPSCPACELDYTFADAGDGPAVFVILIAGFVVAAAALVTEFRYAPPLWVHAALWGPLAVILCLGALRALKGILITLQYRYQAAEGRVEHQQRLEHKE